MSQIHWLLAIQSLVIVLGSVNRLTSFTTGYVLPNQYLRWVDFLNMLVIPAISVCASYFLKAHLEHRATTTARRWQRIVLTLLFILGIYWLAASYGTHEVTNYLNVRFCGADSPLPENVCAIIAFNDDDFSHHVFFIAFTLINIVLLLTQVLHPLGRTLRGRDRILLTINALFIALGIFANLAFEVIGFDLWVVVALTGLSLYLLRRHGAQPLLYYYSVAYSVGLLATVVAIALREPPV
ncbi:MAG: hypothetical protein SF123_15795 [Chloroflexota bacterium]|nr:hypothetical protein [Chloroflexota bacterium]